VAVLPQFAAPNIIAGLVLLLIVKGTAIRKLELASCFYEEKYIDQARNIEEIPVWLSDVLL
jgi:hypothetical protein